MSPTAREYPSRTLRRGAASLLLVLLSVHVPLDAVELRVQLSGDQGSSDLADAVVSLHPVQGAAAASPGTAVMDQRSSAFVPRVLPVRVGTKVSFPNSDRIRHQVYSFSQAKPFELPLYAGANAVPVDFDKPGIVVVGCNIHDSMIGYVVVLDTPHFGRAGEGGEVVLDAPAGNYRMQVWHPRLRGAAVRKPVTIQAGSPRQLRVALDLPAAAQQGRGPERLRALRDKFRRIPRSP